MNRFDIDTAKRETTLDEAARRCGVTLELYGTGSNVRMDCPFHCPGDHVGKHELSVSRDGDKLFCCHAYSCGFRGNLLLLMHGWLTGSRPASGTLKGEDFRRVRDVLLGHAAEKSSPPSAPEQPSVKSSVATSERKPDRNTPLAQSENAKARELVGLEQLLVTDPAEMSPSASAYWRQRRQFFTAEICSDWGVGFRPTKNDDDKRGWSLRGQVCYRFLSEDNKDLCYVGRDPEYEQKLAMFESLTAEQRLAQKLKAPIKHRFPTGFHRGLELYGQHSSRLERHTEYKELIARHGILVVEGFNDVLALDCLKIPAVAICSNRITHEQVAKVTRWAKLLAQGKVTLMFDCQDTGDEGAKEALWLFAQIAPDINVRLAWSKRMHGGKFSGRQPESLTLEEWEGVIRPAIVR
jgi:hypothetical protein